MKRFQLFEFCDQKWLPQTIREAFHDCLGLAHNITYRPYINLPPLLADVARRTNATTILDIASGGGEQIGTLHDFSKKTKLPAFILSDLYPHVKTWQKLQENYGKQAICFYDKPLNFNDIPSDSPRLWSIFTAFHHLSPPLAKQLVDQAITNSDGLIIAEFFRRRLPDILSVFLAIPCNFLFAPFFAKEFTLKKMLFTTIIPIVPLMACFDGIVSVLRTYKKDEIIAMLPANWQDNFDIEYHELATRVPFMKATAFILVRKNI